MMSPLSYALDPQADLELVLHKPNAQVLLPLFASMSLTTAASNQAFRELATKLSQRSRPISTATAPAPNPFQPPLTTLSANGVSNGTTLEFASAYNITPNQLEITQHSEVRFQVSSKHLKLASPVFRAMLDGPWREGTASNGSCRSISASDWNKDALLILLNIVHGHHREVPKSLNLETLCKLATIVDYYKCHEIVEIFADRWLRTMGNGMPTFHSPESTLCLCVAWVFRWPEQFECMTELALRHGEGLVETTELPIAGILERIDEKRQNLISRLLEAIDNLRSSLCNDEDVCSFECSSMLLGSLMKEMHKISRLGPLPTKPYNGYSVEGLLQRISNIRSPQWYALRDLSSHKGRNRHSCNLMQKIQPILDDTEKRLHGWKLEDFS
ncbi:hypothetical protein B0J15DRAFT_505963 [Fusarium solani]|uniref:BTB domain-containing protein n=1 Tax=Fusarium solani TaxID=169388 RepID=A0A9P9G1D3_FUSSL|nr:uncharacterized protein B0J15DRAFT_505963 [Fusarium solani]KAH7231445.1 hypothetical protein B0J15DRAFT_505963 [Fusarium solani]